LGLKNAQNTVIGSVI